MLDIIGVVLLILAAHFTLHNVFYLWVSSAVVGNAIARGEAGKIKLTPLDMWVPTFFFIAGAILVML